MGCTLPPPPAPTAVGPAAAGWLKLGGRLFEGGGFKRDEWTPLHDAVKSGRMEMATALLKAGADVNAKCK
ncbi:hypothetical protein TSOC_015147, partial [Tetrabaena socialis]